MPTETEETTQPENTMFAVGGSIPWDGVGISLDNPPTLKDALHLAGLDHTVSLKKLGAVIGTDPEGFDEIIDVPGYFATVRETDDKVLGIVKGRYQVMQNEQALEFFNPFVESGLVTLETAGSLKDGKKIWILAKIKDRTTSIIGDDVVEPYLLVYNSHDGSTNADLLFTPTRVVCMNTLRAALSHARNHHRVRHTGNITAKLEKVQEEIAQTNSEFQNAVDIYRSLATKDINSEQFDGYIKRVFGEDIRKDKKEKLVKHFESGKGQDLPGVAGTAWAAYNAVTEYLSYDYGRSVDTRLDSLWFGQNLEVNQNALVFATEL